MRLTQKLEAAVVTCAFVIELTSLSSRQRVAPPVLLSHSV